jgi:hypothetical protein
MCEVRVEAWIPLPARMDRDAGADLANGRPFPLGDGGIAKPAGGGERQRIKTTVTPAAGFLRARRGLPTRGQPNFWG